MVFQPHAMMFNCEGGGGDIPKFDISSEKMTDCLTEAGIKSMNSYGSSKGKPPNSPY